MILRQAFVFGRLPELVATFEEFASASSSSAKANQPKFRPAVEHALAIVFTNHSPLLDACDLPRKGKGSTTGDNQSMDVSTGDDVMKDDLQNKDGSDEPRTSPFRRHFLGALVRRGLISPDCAKSLYPPLATSSDADTSLDAMEIAPHPFSSEGIVLETGKIAALAQEAGVSTQDYCDYIFVNGSPEDMQNILLQMLEDFSSQAAVATSVQKVFAQLTTSPEGLEHLSALCKLLSENANVLDVLSLHICISELVADGKGLVDDFDVSSAGDPNTAHSQLGSIILFLQVSTHPKTLLHMAASLFSEALANKNTDVHALISGAVAYFLEPLFNWCLVGIVRGLADEALRKGYRAGLHLRVIQAIVTDSSCPQVVWRICGRSILRMLDSKSVRVALELVSFDEVKAMIHGAIGITEPSPWIVGVKREGETPSTSSNSGMASTLVQLCAKTYASRAPPSITTFQFYTPQNQLEAVHSALLSCAKSSDSTRASRQLAVALFWLAQTSRSPPLIPYFINSYLPTNILPSIERAPPTEQTNLANATAFLVGYTLLTSFRSERAVIDVKRVESRSSFSMDVSHDDEHERTEREMLKEAAASCPSVLLATQLAKRLKTHLAAGKTVGASIHKRLLAVPQFASNFPGFASA
ncbi:mediator complex subunit [Tulasnella sp. 408]|nr:mediator complex subunit [Tulasnella sp. 408]